MSFAGAKHTHNGMNSRVKLDTNPHLKVEIGDPVDQVEECKSSREKDTCVRVYLGNANVQPALPPGSGAAVFETAEETGAVLSIETIITIFLISLLHVCGVVHLDGCG